MYVRQRPDLSGVTLSQNKSVVVDSHPQLLRAVRRELLGQGLSFEGAPSVRDVGLDANAGHRRSVKIQNKREQKCRKRNAHIKVIQNGLKTKHQAKKLFKTGTLPATSYGHAAMGMCPSCIHHKRTMAADACGKRIKTACTTTILHFHFRENGDPAIWFPLDQLRTWFKLQGEDMGHRQERIDVARAWAAASGNTKKKSKWSIWLKARGRQRWQPCAISESFQPLRGNGTPLKNQMSIGPTLVVILVLSSVKLQQRLSHKVLRTGGAALTWSRCGKWCQHDTTNSWSHAAHMSMSVCCTKSSQHKSMMAQGSASTIPAPKLFVSCAGHRMTQCFIAFMIFPASPHPSTWTQPSE